MKIEEILANLSTDNRNELLELFQYLADNNSLLIENEVIRKKVIEVLNADVEIRKDIRVFNLLWNSFDFVQRFSYRKNKLEFLVRHYELLIGSIITNEIADSLISLIYEISTNAKEIFSYFKSIPDPNFIIDIEDGYPESFSLPTHPFYILSELKIYPEGIVEFLNDFIKTVLRIDRDCQRTYQETTFDYYTDFFEGIVYYVFRSPKNDARRKFLEYMAVIETDYEDIISRTSVWALGEIRSEESIPLLMDYKLYMDTVRRSHDFEEDTVKRDLAIEALKKINKKEIEFKYLLQILQSDFHYSLKYKEVWLSRIDQDEFSEIMLNFENEENPNVIVNIGIALKLKGYSILKYEKKIREALTHTNELLDDADEIKQYLFS